MCLCYFRSDRFNLLYRYWILFVKFCRYLWNKCFIYAWSIVWSVLFWIKGEIWKVKNGFSETWKLCPLVNWIFINKTLSLYSYCIAHNINCFINEKFSWLFILCCFDWMVYFFLAIYSCHKDLYRVLLLYFILEIEIELIWVKLIWI